MAESADVIVVGAGNAALCAALAARQTGAHVVVLEAAPFDERGGNSAYTGGSIRVPYHGIDDVRQLIPDLSQDEIDNADWGSYDEAAFFEDIGRVTDHRADPDLAELLVTKSFDVMRWMQEDLGVKFVPTYGRYAHKVGDRMVFWGGPVIEVTGGGMGLVNSLFDAAEREGIDIRYETRAVRLLRDGGVTGVVAVSSDEEVEFHAPAVVLGAGGFQANTEWRAKYLGPGWDLAKVRGTRFNTGDGIQMALDIGAVSHGHWSGCHAVGWDLNAPESGDISIGDGFNKHQYVYGIMVNAGGKRFVDEGADFRNNTYAKYGRKVLEQPSQFAWQIFDSKVSDLLRPDFYRHRRVTKVQADTLDELVTKLEGVDAEQCLQTVREYNDAVQDGEFNPTTLDGCRTDGLEVPKSNWALRIDEPPFEAFAVTCGITFTFGGVRIDTDAKVLDTYLRPIPGLYACGEMAAGLFYFNYPGSTGLSWGSVTGKSAGEGAAQVAAQAK